MVWCPNLEYRVGSGTERDIYKEKMKKEADEEGRKKWREEEEGRYIKPRGKRQRNERGW